MLSNKYFQNDQLCEEMNSRILPYDIGTFFTTIQAFAACDYL